uniref:general transcription factor II-I repeat domain-containing protein 2-like isoform X2 n=1 Tax=Gasterosteus aculeatus aculeatus TaxID=481459 RepID=UPI001A99E91F|nr:general transcription factor II-I repeat domain-containing protein 2-like isoform X2 [Gasterosteus aculeatus aculeatus]
MAKRCGKRKIDSECRVFNPQWTRDYFFVQLKEKAVCLVCQETVAVFKEYNLRRHYESRHKDKYASRASFRVAQLIASCGKSFTEGEFVKKCLNVVVEEVCPEKKDVFNAVSLLASTITRRVEEIGGNVYAQLQQKTKDFQFFSLALDESTDVQDTAELLIFIRLIGRMNREMEERGLTALLQVHCLIHQQALCCKVLKWDSVMKVVVSCINFIRANGLKHRQFQQFLSELESAYGDVLYHTEIRWLSRGKVLRRFYELLPEVNAFLQSKGKTVPELIDPAWKWHLAFLTDVTELLNGLNLQLQGKGKLICDMYSHIKGFEVKLRLVLEQVEKHNFTHLPATQSFSAEKPSVVFPGEKCVEALEMMKAEFGVRFRELHVHAKEIRLFQNPFVADIDEAQPSYQFELAELQNCDVLKDAFKPNSLIDFYAALPNDTYPNIKQHAIKMSTLFGSMYICEQTFSRMKLLKTPTRSRLTDEHLHQCLRLAVTRMEPDIQLLSSQMQAHSSH